MAASLHCARPSSFALSTSRALGIPVRPAKAFTQRASCASARGSARGHGPREEHRPALRSSTMRGGATQKRERDGWRYRPVIGRGLRVASVPANRGARACRAGSVRGDPLQATVRDLTLSFAADRGGPCDRPPGGRRSTARPRAGVPVARAGVPVPALGRAFREPERAPFGAPRRAAGRRSVPMRARGHPHGRGRGRIGAHRLRDGPDWTVGARVRPISGPDGDRNACFGTNVGRRGAPRRADRRWAPEAQVAP